MAKQVNLLEALGSRYPGLTTNTVGAIYNEVGSWPHESVKDAMKSLYKFTCDYPGIRHGGDPTSALRVIDMRDMVAMSILLTGFTPYLESRLSADAIFGGSSNPAGPFAPGAAPVVVAASAQVALPRLASLLRHLAFWRRGR